MLVASLYRAFLEDAFVVASRETPSRARTDAESSEEGEETTDDDDPFEVLRGLRYCAKEMTAGMAERFGRAHASSDAGRRVSRG